MPTCKIDVDASPTFKRLLKEFKREAPHIIDDLTDAFSRIEADFRHAAGANAQPGYDERIWKYECNSQDYKRGAKGAFRIIAYYAEATGTLYPILLYFKPRNAMLAVEVIDAALQEITDLLAVGTVAQSGAFVCEHCQISDDSVREERHDDIPSDRLFVFILCSNCVAQLRLTQDRTEEFTTWLAVRLTIYD